jgi:diaminohydroxyphosphoribosylaminopyrimidine deaminase / 5-amino-6-(5-phosphoribosylamino)uracil reductase
MSAEFDKRMMQRCLELAEKGMGRTAPNPMVGSVIVTGGTIVGEGYHPAAGRPHAERVALKRAGSRSRGATLYVSLEPCSHTGRTPPCADAVIEAGISRVVAAMRDPNPRVRGRGIARLRRAGVKVEVGVLGRLARRLNEAFVCNVTTGSVFVALKLAQTLDGKIAAGPSVRTRISGPESLRLTHRLRAAHSAVMVGASTVLADDPMLNVRGIKNAPQPIRVVLDPALRTPPGCKLAVTAGEFRTILVYDHERADVSARNALEEAGLELAGLECAANGLFDIAEVNRLLFGLGITSVLVEGGRRLTTALLHSRQAQRLHMFIAPTVLGEGAALHGIGNIGTEGGALELRNVEQRLVGEDFYLTARLD